MAWRLPTWGGGLRLGQPGVRSGAALIVVVGVLAALLAMAMTFALVTRVEMRASRNQAVADQARALAWSYLETYARRIRIADFAECDTDAGASRPNANGWVSAADTNAVIIEDEDRKFNLNAMGFPGDLGWEHDLRQRFTSFEASLVRLFLDRLSSTDQAAVEFRNKYAPHYDDADKRRGMATLFVTGLYSSTDGKWRQGLMEWRYGYANTVRLPDPATGVPHGVPGTAGNDFDLEQRWGWTLDVDTSAWSDDGIRYPGDYPAGKDPMTGYRELGWKDGCRSIWGFLSGGNLYFRSEWGTLQEVWQGRIAAGDWGDDCGTGYPTADADPNRNLGYHDSVPSAIRGPDGILHAEPRLRDVSTGEINELFEFDPEHPVGDDRPFTAVCQIIPIIQEILVAEGRAPAQAWREAEDFYHLVKDYLTVYSHTRQAPRHDGRGGLVSINDWRYDRIDNNYDGVVDTDAESFTPQLLRRRLGLDDIVAQGWITQKQANQLVANIIDFRDSDAVPTLVQTVPGQSDANDAWGSEGLHITEVMASPQKVPLRGDGSEMTDAGGGWTWQGTFWRQDDAGGERVGQWTFRSLPALGINLRAGWYAIRIYGANGNNLKFAYDGVEYPVTTDRPGDGGYYGYVRNGTKLLAVEVKLVGSPPIPEISFGIRAATGQCFYGIRLIPAYVEITNIAMQRPTLATTHAIDISGWTLTSDTDSLTLSGTRSVPPATVNGVFPVDYGNFIIAIGEAPYARQWGVGSPPDDEWGNTAEEGYPVYFVGDVEADAGADAFVKLTEGYLTDGQRLLTLRLRDPSGRLVAGGEVDGLIGVPFTEGVSREKDDILGTNWADYTNIRLDPGGVDTDYLVGSQNRAISVPGIGSTMYTCLNRNYMYLPGTTTPALFSNYGVHHGDAAAFRSLDDLRTDRLALPIVLNRAYASPGWLGLVPSGTPWRTIDPCPPDASTPPKYIPSGPHHLLGRLLARAIVGGVYARVNINTAPEPVLKAIFSDAATAKIIARRNALQSGSHPAGWTSWDEFLDDALFQEGGSGNLGFYGNGSEDSGAASYGDDFPDDSDEREEFIRRFANLITIRSSAFRIRVDARVAAGKQAGLARLEAILDRDRDVDGDGIADGFLRAFRYITEE